MTGQTTVPPGPADAMPGHDLRPGYAVTPPHDLRPGSPDVAGFPVAAWQRAARRALARAPAAAFGYGDPRGRIELRAALAGYLGRTRGVLARPEQIVITSGMLQSLALLGRVLTAAGPATIAMEDPGLPLHREAAAGAGLTVLPLPVDGDGARVGELAGSGARAVVVTPAHQYPTGVVLHPDRRHWLARWAAATGALIIEDDYDGEFRYDRQPVGAVQGVAPGQVAYFGTASKTLGPGLRLGWLVLPPGLVRPVAEAKRLADSQAESPGQLTLAEMITGHDYDRQVRASRLRYRRRRDLLIARLRPRAGRPLPGYALQGIAAGLHALVTLPGDGPGEDDIVARAAERGLAIEGLAGHWHDPASQADRTSGILVGYATPAERAYPAALDTLISVLSLV